MTHFPYVSGEQDYEPDVLGGDAQRLSADHVMCFMSVGWFQPTDQLGDGEEAPRVESQHDMLARMNREVVPPGQAALDAREEQMRRMGTASASRVNTPAR